MELDDLFGWLIDKDEADELNKLYKENLIGQDWNDELIWCIPKIINEHLNIEFTNYD